MEGTSRISCLYHWVLTPHTTELHLICDSTLSRNCPAARVSRRPPSSSSSAPIKKQQRHRVSQSPRDHADLSMTNICPDRCWKCSDQPGSRTWLPSLSSRHPSPICVFLFFFWPVSGEHIKSKRSHCIILSSHLIFSSEQKSGPLPLPDWGFPLRKGLSHHFVQHLCESYLDVVFLHSATSPDWEFYLRINTPSPAKTKLLPTTLFLTLSSSSKMIGCGRTIFWSTDEGHGSGSVPFSTPTWPIN